MRCISLAKALQKLNFNVVFFGDFHQVAQQFAQYFSQQLLLTSDSVISRVSSLPADSQILIDSYNYATRDLPGSYRYVLIDDFFQHDIYPVCGVINFTLKAARYNYLNKGAKQQALGVDYYLPHPAISGLRLEAKTQVTRVLIMIGSGDTNNLSVSLFETVRGIDPSIEIKIVLTHSDCAITSQIPSKLLVPPTPEVDSLYRWADLCITSGGLAKYELAYLANPAAIYPLTKDEAIETREFSDAGLCFDLLSASGDDKNLVSKLTNIITSSSMREIARKCCLQVFSEGSASKAANFVQQCLKGS